MKTLVRNRPVHAVICLFAFVTAVALLQGCSSEKTGEESGSRLMRATFSVPAMCCTSCAMKTTLALEAFGGVEKAHSDFLKKEAWARFDPNMVDAEKMRKAIEALGLKGTEIVSVEPWKPDPIPDPG